MGIRTFILFVISIVSLGGLSAPLEVALPKAHQITNQGKVPVCGIHAMASFLEIWGNERLLSKHRLPRLSLSFLAMGYNLRFGSLGRGTQFYGLFSSVDRYGVLPVRVMSRDWEKKSQKLLPEEETKSELTAGYKIGNRPEFVSGKQYLDEVVGIDFREFDFYQTPLWRRTYQGPVSTVPKPPDTNQYRRGTYHSTLSYIIAENKKERLPSKHHNIGTNPLTSLAVAQLYRYRPVLVSINTRAVRGEFRDYQVISSKDVEYTNYLSHHAMVAVGHCFGQSEGRKELCRPFRKAIQEECVVFQNSYGTQHHHQGYLCITRGALNQMLMTALIQKGHDGSADESAPKGEGKYLEVRQKGEVAPIGAQSAVTLATIQLFRSKPVWVEVNLGVLTKDWRELPVYSSKDLLPVGEEEVESSAFFLLGHCHESNRERLEVCKPFSKEILKLGVDECFVAQIDALEGKEKRRCLSRKVLVRMIKAVRIRHEILMGAIGG